jgi:predicted transcriptional regulator
MENQQIKTSLYALIEETDDVQLLEEIEIMLLNQNTKQDFWDVLPASQKESIERGVEQAAKGETTAHEDVLKKYEKWLTK